MNKVLNKKIPEFFVKKNNSDPIVICKLPIEDIKANFEFENRIPTFRKNENN